jgi:SAM-dependent methyltransferase
MASTENIINGVNEYYTNKIALHGDNSLGVDWNSKESQYLRFQQLSGILSINHFDILDYGCGTGEYVNYLTTNKYNFEYCGYDISDEMIKKAKEKFEDFNNTQFVTQFENRIFDYSIASGIFNVKLDLASNKEWLDYIIETINSLNKFSKSGFSFNALTKYSDKEYLKEYLYYADPLFLFDYCKTHFSHNVALLHDYNLYEFTILVKK